MRRLDAAATTVVLETLGDPASLGKRGTRCRADTGFHGEAMTVSEGLLGDSSLFGAVARLQRICDVAGNSDAVLASAAAAVARIEQEINLAWRESMKAEDGAMSQRLAQVSHALRRTARLLEPDLAIG
jgi:hypothetical protein